MTTLILGAGGFLGINLVDAMQAAGMTPRCGRRKRSNVLALRQRNAQLVEADLGLPETLHSAMQGCRTVIHLAGHYPRLSNEPGASLARGLRETQAVLDAAAASGVQRLIYVSSTATVAPRPDRPSNEQDLFTAAPGFGAYHDLKWHMEQAVSAERRFEVSTVCPGACLGAHDWKIGTSALLWQLVGGEGPQHPDGILSWVDVGDVATALVRMLALPTLPRRLLVAAESLRFHDLLLKLAARYGVPNLPPPMSAEAAVAFADAEEARVAVQKGRAKLSREIADLLIHGPRIDASASRALLDLHYRPMETTLATFDAWASRMGAQLPTTKGVQRDERRPS